MTHIDVETLDQARAKEIRKMLDENGLSISSLGYYPNPLHPDPEHRAAVIEHLKKVIEAAALLEVPVVGTFIGKDKNKTVPANLEEYAKVWPPIVKFARRARREDRHRELPDDLLLRRMAGRQQPGQHAGHLAQDVGDHPRRQLRPQPGSVAPDPADDRLRAGGARVRTSIFHVHAKDLQIDREGLYQHGVLSQGMGWQVPRLPGLGDVDWGKFIARSTAPATTT